MSDGLTSADIFGDRARRQRQQKKVGVIDRLQIVLETLRRDFQHVSIVGFTDEPKGDKQESDVPGFNYEWVDQTCGICGDDFQGNVYFEMESGLFVDVCFAA